VPDGRIPWLMQDVFGDLEAIPPAPRWQYRAACLGMDPELFVGEGKGWQPGPALEVCAGCLVRDECYRWAVAEGFGHGVFGGATEKTRRRARQTAA
jgi:WhiB family transcriptional regulator, redox-sensing transcriptional regulator